MKSIALAMFVSAARVLLPASGAVLTFSSVAHAESLGDLSSLKAIIVDVQSIARTGDFAAAEKRITDFETAWDQADATLKPKNKKAWHHIDDASDAALKALRARKPDAAEVDSTLAALVAALDNP